MNSVRSGFQLQLGFATIPVDLFSVIPSDKGKSGMRILCAEHKIPIRQQYVCPTDGHVATETVKGYEQTKGKFVIPKDESDEILPEEGITLAAVPINMVEEQTLPGSTMYYLKPHEAAIKGWEIMYRLAKDKKRALIGQTALRKNSRKMYRLIIFNDYLCLQSLEFPEHIREAPDTPHVKVEKALMDQAKQVLDSLEVPWDKLDIRDEGLARFRKMVETGEVVSTGTGVAVEGDNVVDLMDALKRSVEQTKAQTRKKKGAK